MSLSSLRTGLFLIIVTLGLSLPGSYVGAAAISDTYVDFQANNCTIPAGKSMCPSTLYVKTYAGRSFNVTNLNRGLTTQNLLTPNNYITIPGSTSPAYTVSTHVTGDAANYISYGESNNLNLFEGTRLIARAVTSARCTSGTIWNGQICSTAGASSPIACTMEARMCPDGSVMPRNMNTCTWLPEQCTPIYPIDPLPPTLSSLSISCTKSTYFLGERISCKIRGGSSIKTCWQTGKSAVVEKNCVEYGWTPDANGIDLTYNGSVTSWMLGNYNLYVRDAAGKTTFTQVRYSDGSAESNVRMDVKACTIESGKSRCAATVDVTAPAGKLFNIENIQRGVTSTNIIRPGLYTITTSILGDDAANYITYGVNDLVLKEGTLPVARASTSAICAINTKWNGQICTAPGPVVNTGATTTSKVTLKTGNGDTVFIDSLYPNISNNFFYQEQVTKNINLPSTTSVINITLSSSKAQCTVSPNYKTDSGISFSNNAKVVNKADLPNFSMTVPTYSVASQVGGVLYGKISTLTVSCATPTESTKDLLIYNINLSSTITPTPINFQANNCIIPVGKSTCASTLYLTAPSGKYFSVKNATRGITTSNLLNPNNYISVAGSSSPMYSVSTHVTGDAANYAKYGDNDLVLYEGTSTVVSIGKAIMNATCEGGSTWNGQACMKTGIMNCSGPTRVCDNGQEMPRNPNTCEWIPEQCTPTIYATQIGLSDYIINDRVYPYNGAEIVVKEGETLSLKGYGRPGALAYFWREGQIMTDSVGLSSTSGEWTLRNVWSPAGARIVIPGTYTYILSGLPPSTVPGTSMQSAQTAVRIKVTPTTTDSYIDFQANNCTIPAGKSTCASTLYLTNPQGKVYTVKNITRGLTTSNLLTPNNYTTVPGSNYPSYSVSTHPTGDAANYATNGMNELSLFDSTSSSAAAIKKAVMTASCASGSTWNGQICISGVITPPTNTPKPMLFIERNPKILGPGQNMTLSWTTTNATSLSYFCSGLGVQANKKVSIALNKTPYSEAWDKLISDGWTGKYECDFIAVGPGGSTVLADTFTITPRGTTPNPTPYTDFQANNCTIQANKSTCVSSIFVRASAGKYFHVTNATRGLTTSNLLNPTNYVSVIGSTTPMYMATAHSTGDAANYITYGVNDLSLKEGTTVISKAVATAECVKGTSWNGKMCIAGGGVACTDVVKYCEDGSIMPRDPNCGWLPSQCGGKTAQPLTITCSKSSYTLGEAVSCKISGGIGTRSCWQLGTKNTEPKVCTDTGWNHDNNILYYYSSVSSSMLGEYVLYVKDTQGNIASTKVSYNNPASIPPAGGSISFEANNCYIPAGQNKCASTIYVKAPIGKLFSVSNLSRGITTSNLLTPNNYKAIPGSNVFAYTASVHSSGDAANYITYGESNTLTLLEGTTVVARAIASAKCIAGTTWNGKTCGTNTGTDPIYCTMEARMCEDGSTMPRDMKSCAWLPGQCPTDTLNPIDPLPPTKPYGTPRILVGSIAGVPLNGDDTIDISKSPTEPLRVKGEITSIRSGYTMKLTSNKSDYYIMMPVSADGVWSTDNSPTLALYQSRMVVEGDNLLTFSLLDDSTKKPVAQSFIKVRVKIVRGGIFIDPPICVMAAGSTGSCTGPILPTYPNCPKTTSSSAISSSSIIYCPPDDATEINPTNTITPKPPVRGNTTGIIAIPPTCIMAEGSTGGCLPPPTTSNCPKPGTSKVVPRGCPTGVIVPIEEPTIPPCTSTSGNSLTIGCNNSVDVVIVDGLPTTPIEEALDAASRKRIDTIIARTRSRVADMSTSSALAFIDSSIKRIQSLPNKTAKAKLIDAYTLSRLQSLRNSIKSSSANSPTDDYIGLVDNVLSSSYQ